MRPAIILDIETLPDPAMLTDADWWDRLKAPANYSKPDSIAAWQQKQQDGAALSPLTGRIAAIGFQIYDTGEEFLFQDEHEQTLLRHFAEAVDLGPSAHPPQVIGWNVRRFDLPFLAGRAAILDVPLPPWFPTTKTFRGDVVDLMTDVFGEGSLDQWQYRVGYDFKTLRGAEILTATPEQREEHLRMDLAATATLARRCAWAWRQP